MRRCVALAAKRLGEDEKCISPPRPPLRSIRFVLWTGEQPGIMGSRFYAKTHAAELEHCVAIVNTDNGVGHPLGWKVAGRSDVGSASITPRSPTF